MAFADALTMDADALATALGVSTDTATRLLGVVEARADAALNGGVDPSSAVADECLLLAAAYLADARPPTTRSQKIGNIEVENVTSHANWWRASGAASILAPFAVRRGGLIR